MKGGHAYISEKCTLEKPLEKRSFTLKLIQLLISTDQFENRLFKKKEFKVNHKTFYDLTLFK